MSCDGWSVGDRCKSKVAMEIPVSQGGSLYVVLVNVGTIGIVQAIQRAVHGMHVNFTGIDEYIRVRSCKRP